MKRFLTELRLTFRRVVRLGTFRRVAKGAAGVRPLALIALFGLWLAMIALVDFLWAGTMPAFNEWGITSALAGWAVFAVSIVLLGGKVPRLPLARAMADSAGIGIAYGLLLAAIGAGGLVLAHWLGFERLLLMDAWYALVYPAFIWLIVVYWRAGRHLWNQHLRFQGLRFLVAALLPIFLIPNQPIVFGSTTDWTRDDVWYWARSAFVNSDTATVSDDTVNREPDIDFEATIYNQPKLVNDALRNILPTPEDRPQMYFVGLAPYSMQDVFKKEVLGGRAVFDERFGTRGRSIALINHQDTVATIALANATNLSVVLNGMGKAMNPKKDVLVLFITTHGSKELLSVSFSGFSLNQITPEKLSAAFEESGIKNRVLIISACYSGSFIPLLKNDDTLIMTAASADKTSFGCSNEREWTYFGDALFNHALRKTRSLPQAFDEARGLIKEWESKEGITPSEPQISIGTSISRVLEGLVIEIGQRADAAAVERQ